MMNRADDAAPADESRQPWTPPVVEFFNLSGAETGNNLLSDEAADGTS